MRSIFACGSSRMITQDAGSGVISLETEYCPVYLTAVDTITSNI